MKVNAKIPNSLDKIFFALIAVKSKLPTNPVTRPIPRSMKRDPTLLITRYLNPASKASADLLKETRTYPEITINSQLMNKTNRLLAKSVKLIPRFNEKKKMKY